MGKRASEFVPKPFQLAKASLYKRRLQKFVIFAGGIVNKKSNISKM